MAIDTSKDRRHDERRRRRRLVLPDRRTGFDRRSAGRSLRGRYVEFMRTYRDNPRALLLVLAIFTVLNLADLVLTYRALILGAREVNPIMDALFEIHPVWAGVVKAGVGAVVAELIWILRRYRRALELSIIAAVMMLLLFGWHLFIGQNLPI